MQLATPSFSTPPPAIRVATHRLNATEIQWKIETGHETFDKENAKYGEIILILVNKTKQTMRLIWDGEDIDDENDVRVFGSRSSDDKMYGPSSM